MNKQKLTTKELSKLAMNAASLKDTFIYRGFVDENLDAETGYEFDDTLVMITPIGEFVGSSPDGKPTKEIIDEDSIKLMAAQTEEILLDRDHASMRNIEERDTEAMGWISGLKAITNLGDMNGLYGIIKWAGKGMQLAKERAYRFLSPVFELDEAGKAVKLVNVALTNRPALKMPPIINGEPQEENISMTETQKDTDTMNKDEIEKMISEMVSKAIAENSKPVEETKEVVNSETTAEEVKTEVVNSEVAVEETKEETKTEVKNEEVEKVEVKEQVENTCEETKTEVKNEEVKEEPKVEEKKEEVIKAETLNSAPVTIGTSVTGMEKWRSLRGAEFFKYLKEHPEVR